MRAQLEPHPCSSECIQTWQPAPGTSYGWPCCSQGGSAFVDSIGLDANPTTAGFNPHSTNVIDAECDHCGRKVLTAAIIADMIVLSPSEADIAVSLATLVSW